MNHKLTHGSLFSGFDAPSVAASWLGWENAFHCEINPFCNEILKYWFPNSEHYEDITKTDFKKWRGKIDVLTGGFPCQPFSLAGRRKGADDNRYLWPHMLRAIREIRPTWVIGENVAGILTMVQPGKETEMGCQTSLFGEDNRKRILLRQEYVVETICKDLEREGYSVQPLLIPACAVGAPHRRDRVWFVAHTNSNGGQEKTERKFKQAEKNNEQSESLFHSGTSSYRSNSGAENVRQEWENTILPDGIAPDTDHHRCRFGKNKQKQFTKCERTPNNSFSSKERIATDTNGERCNDRSDNWKERPIYYDRQRYSEKNQSEWDKRKYRTGEDGSATTDSQCPGSGQVLEEIQSEKPDGHSVDRNGCEWDAAYPDSEKLQKRIEAGRRSDTKKNGTGMDNGVERFSGLQYAPDSDNKRLQEFHVSQWDDAEKREIEKRCSKQYSCDDWRTLPTKDWQDFPTQSPVFRGNDGLPFNVDNLTIPFTRWRQESIKGYGNAIVPQVILEIFKAIEEIEQSE